MSMVLSGKEPEVAGARQQQPRYDTADTKGTSESPRQEPPVLTQPTTTFTCHVRPEAIMFYSPILYQSTLQEKYPSIVITSIILRDSTWHGFLCT